jgi:8-oxo-dGTP pyrophosphatase MutT (NUDIX family)
VPVLTRLRPQRWEKERVLQTAVEVAQDPHKLNTLPKGAREQVEEVVKAIQLGTGWNPKSAHPQPNKPVSAAVVGVRAAQLLNPSSSITPVDVAEALQAQGLTWVQPFAPGTPLVPFYGYSRQPRVYNYEIGRNVTTETRPDRIPFSTLRHLFDAYDVARTCTRHSINDLRSMRVRFEVADGCEENPVKAIAEARKRLRRPDGIRTFKNWLAENMLNLWMYDSAPIYRMRDKAGNVTRLINVDAPTIAPMLDYYGQIPAPPAPGFVQFIEGVPWDWLTQDDIIYEPFWPQTDGPYGTPPLETVLLNANTDVRLQIYFLQFFTAGAVPEALAIAPPDMTSPDDLADFEEQYSAIFNGDQAERWGLKWLPHGTELNFYKPQTFDPELAEYVERRTVAAFGLTPQDLGILSDVNRATSDTQMDTQFRISTLPIVGYYEDLLDSIIQDDWGLPVQLRFDTGREKEDRLMEAQAHQLYIQMGAESPDEVREKVLGHPVNPEEKVPRFVMDPRLGVIPLAHVIAISGEVDPRTGAPKPGSVQPQPYQLPGNGPIPAAGPTPPGHGVPPKGIGERALSRSPAKKESDEEEDQEDEPHPQIPSNAHVEGVGYGFAGIGSTAQGTGIAPDLAKWRTSARKAIARGRRPKRFVSEQIPESLSEVIWSQLEVAKTREDVDAAFKRVQAAGIVVQAESTGRVLMVQRSPDKHDPNEAYARWEFPGGTLDPYEDPWEGALREWTEETGAHLPAFHRVGDWTSPDGLYLGFVVRVPHEFPTHPDPEEVSAATWWAPWELDDPTVRDKVTDSLDRIFPLVHKSFQGPDGRFKTASDHHLRRFYPHIEEIVAHYVPPMRDAMAQVLSRSVIDDALGALRKAVPAGAAPTARNTGLTPNQVAAFTSAGITAGTAAGMAAGPLAGAGVLGAGSLGVLSATAHLWGTVVASLSSAPRNLGPLQIVFDAIYGEGALQGGWIGSRETHGSLPPWMLTIDIPEGYFEHWRPGVGLQASKVGGGGLGEVLQDRDYWMSEVVGTQINRIANVLWRLYQGEIEGAEARDKIDAILHDESRARLIADTEFMRAFGKVLLETYVHNGVEELEWVTQPGACHLCVENKAASPQPASHPHWPNGGIPVHPHERCVIVPVGG